MQLIFTYSVLHNCLDIISFDDIENFKKYDNKLNEIATDINKISILLQRVIIHWQKAKELFFNNIHEHF